MNVPLNQCFTPQEKRLFEDEYLEARYSPTVTTILYFKPTDINLGLDVVAHERDFDGKKIDKESYFYMGFNQLLEPVDKNIVYKFYGTPVRVQ